MSYVYRFFSEFIVKYGQICCEISVSETTVFSNIYHTDHVHKFYCRLFLRVCVRVFRMMGGIVINSRNFVMT